MPVSVKLPVEFQGVYDIIFKHDHGKGTIQLVINELRRHLAGYKLTVKLFQERYKMDFEEFKSKKVVESPDYSFEVEEAYCDWEPALDGIQTISKELKKLAKYS